MPFRDFAVHHVPRNKKLFRNGIPVKKIIQEWYSCTEKKLFRNGIPEQKKTQFQE